MIICGYRSITTIIQAIVTIGSLASPSMAISPLALKSVGRGGNCKWVQIEVDIEKHMTVPNLSPAETNHKSFVEVQFQGNPVKHIVMTVSRLSQPLLVHFQSYAGKSKFVAMDAQDIFPDPRKLCMDCAYALKQIKEATLSSVNDEDTYKRLLLLSSILYIDMTFVWNL
eukprot:Gb_07596 [translate_table: standard]